MIDRKQIAKRVLISSAGPQYDVNVLLDEPRFHAETDTYECSYRISGQGFDVTSQTWGVDAFQAIQSALIVIGGEISRIERRTGARLRFGDLDHAGFPLP